MSSHLFTDVNTDTNSLLLFLGPRASPPPLPRAVHASLPVIAPAPQRPAADFATILCWEESEDTPQHNLEGTQPTNDAYLKSGGLYMQNLFAQGRIMAKYAEGIYHQEAMSDPALMNQAPPWPPAPELVANPPDWGRPMQNAVTPPALSSASRALDVARPSDTCSWSSMGSNVSSKPSDFLGERSWDTDGTSAYSEDGDEDGVADDEYATGWFVGRDGSLWPVPPPECAPAGYKFPRKRAAATATAASCAATGIPTFLVGDCGAQSCNPEPAGLVVWAADTAGWDSDDSSMSSVSPSRSHTASPPSPELPTTPPDVGSAPSLADLGRQWYASFGKDIGAPPLSASFDPRPFVPPATTAQSSAPEEVPGTFRRGRGVGSRGASPVPGPGKHPGYFVGRDGIVWPLPPPPPVAYSSRNERGRTRIPKW
ncbi:hypothetical protein BD413DRAFT_610083 [Trametes elegans]|nr:hypothetical protein BD413DRAFT_610083 [Trametes elegans]